jgi:hypothetical protein
MYQYSPLQKNYSTLDFWHENKPSGIPDFKGENFRFVPDGSGKKSTFRFSLYHEKSFSSNICLFFGRITEISRKAPDQTQTEI